MYELHSHVDFPSHESGSSLDLVISDIPCLLLSIKPLSTAGISGRSAVLTLIVTDVGKDNRKVRTVGENRLAGCKSRSTNTEWGILLQGSIDSQVNRLTNKILDIQKKYVPHRSSVEKPHDPPRLDHPCYNVAKAKYESWGQFKERQSRSHKSIKKQACRKLAERNPSAGEKSNESNNTRSSEWWNLTKNMQVIIPPLTPNESRDNCRKKQPWTPKVLLAFYCNKPARSWLALTSNFHLFSVLMWIKPLVQRELTYISVHVLLKRPFLQHSFSSASQGQAGLLFGNLQGVYQYAKRIPNRNQIITD